MEGLKVLFFDQCNFHDRFNGPWILLSQTNSYNPCKQESNPMHSSPLNSCVAPEGRFVWGLHRPEVSAHNFRNEASIRTLGYLGVGTPFDNRANYPEGHLPPLSTDPIYEIPNPFPFRGRTYIIKPQADRQAKAIHTITLPPLPQLSFTRWLEEGFQQTIDPEERRRLLASLPPPMQLAIATSSNDEEDLIGLAHLACEIVMDGDGRQPLGLRLQTGPRGIPRGKIHLPDIFKVLINNPNLPDAYKEAMVLRPGIQGTSPIVGDTAGVGGKSRVNEYLRHNSYIPWGHYAANMADDAIRYRIEDLTLEDVCNMRRLYYQRTFARVAHDLGLEINPPNGPLDQVELETLRLRILDRLAKPHARWELSYNSTLWGWNLGFDYSPTGYRLHASHQQAHQQFALVPTTVPLAAAGSEEATGEMTAYHCGNLIQQFITQYRRDTGQRFFEAYFKAIDSNSRTDGAPQGPKSLVVWSTPWVMLMVPKAQTSQWELNIIARSPVGNILEAGPELRRDLDRALWLAPRILDALGAKMITTIEYSKPFSGGDEDQRLIYALLPKMPYSPGSFTEAQMRWINGHYPEDFAEACRRRLGSDVPHP
jgi:hypothetical protein